MKRGREKGRFFVYVRELAAIYYDSHVSRSAAELSYFLTLSVFPALICLHAMLVRFLPGISLTLDELEGFIPAETLGIIAGYLEYVAAHNDRTLVTAGVVGMATTAAAAFRSLHSIMGDIQGGSRFKGVFTFVFSFAFSLLFMSAIYFAVIVIATGDWLIRLVGAAFPIVAGLQLWNWLRFPLMLLIFIWIIYGLYRLTAPKDLRGTYFPGAAAAAGVLVLVSVLFSWFISISTRYPLIYGSLASVIIFMLWLYICGQILIMGNALNVVLRRHRAASR
ncbi:MAG: YihY family inner membrane protein [Oscillospiraceae bacterium]|nr:YihY family inner membrane protein [Oscillospiraceae bacterium]